MELEPGKLLARLRSLIPEAYAKDLVVVGSMAAACHFEARLAGRAINTKDADVVLGSAGGVRACRELAGLLLDRGWQPRREKDYAPQPSKTSSGKKPYIKLNLPGGGGFFLEFLGLPKKDERAVKREVELKLRDGWYAIPVFRFMRVVTTSPIAPRSGMRYAAPAMLALANLLSHPEIGAQTMSYDKRLRAAKDLGRVLALALLSGPEEMETWPERWLTALRTCFPKTWATLVPGVGAGLTELFERPRAVQDAMATVAGLGLLRGFDVTETVLRGAAEELRALAIEPLKARVSARRR